MKVKLFVGTVLNRTDAGTQPLEDEINTWLSNQPKVTISDVKFSSVPHLNSGERIDAVCLVFYEDAKEMASA